MNEYTIEGKIVIDIDIVIFPPISIDIETVLPILSVEKKTDLFRLSMSTSQGDTYQYIGQAPYGSEEDEAVWYVTRIVYDSLGAKIVKQVYANQKWSDYKN